jgi:hypothetical protein
MPAKPAKPVKPAKPAKSAKSAKPAVHLDLEGEVVAEGPKYQRLSETDLSQEEKDLLDQNPRKEKIKAFIYNHATMKNIQNPFALIEDIGEEALNKKLSPETLKQKAEAKTKVEKPIIMLNNIAQIETNINYIIDKCCADKWDTPRVILDTRTDDEMIKDNMLLIKELNKKVMERNKERAKDAAAKAASATKAVAQRAPGMSPKVSVDLGENLAPELSNFNSIVNNLLHAQGNIEVWEPLMRAVGDFGTTTTNKTDIVYDTEIREIIKNIRILFDYSRRKNQPNNPKGTVFNAICVLQLLLGYYIVDVDTGNEIHITNVETETFNGYPFGRKRLIDQLLSQKSMKKIKPNTTKGFFIEFFSHHFGFNIGEFSDMLTLQLSEQQTLEDNLPVILAIFRGAKIKRKGIRTKKKMKKTKGKTKGKKNIKTIKKK